MSPINRRYVSFGERQLIPLFWKWDLLRKNLISLVKNDGYFSDPKINPAQDGCCQRDNSSQDARISENGPIDGLSQYESHLQNITSPDFDANSLHRPWTSIERNNENQRAHHPGGSV